MVAQFKSETPHSNTGSPTQVKSSGEVFCHLDYLVLCGQGDIVEVNRAVWCCFGTVFDFTAGKPGTRGRFYDTILTSAQGLELAYTVPHEQTGLSDYRLSVPGKPLRHIKPDRLFDFGSWFLRAGVRCSRFDWAIDDYARSLSLDSIEECTRTGDFAGANTSRVYKQRRRGRSELGHTIYIGSPGSDKQVRIYDKFVESRGEIDAIRYEVQWRDELAHACFTQLFSAGNPEHGSQIVSGYAVGSVSFIRRTSRTLSRCPVFDWWQDFVDRVGFCLKLSVPRIQPMLSAKKRWIENQVAGTIALITRCMGFDDAFAWLEREVREKLTNLPSRAVSFVESWRDRQVVERGEFEDFWVIDGWN